MSDRHSRIWVAICLCIAGLGCENSESSFSDRLSLAARESLGKPVPTIDFSKITRFDWDKMCVFRAYTGASEIESTLGYHWEEAVSRAETLLSDGVTWLVFTKGETVVMSYEITGWIGDFDLGWTNRMGFEKSAIFDVKYINTPKEQRFILAPHGS